MNTRPETLTLQNNLQSVELCAFALTDCVVELETQSARYLRAVHRTALELAVPNLFGLEIGGYWLRADQVRQLRRLADCYPDNEIRFVRRAVEAYLLAQTEKLDWIKTDH
ncbi:MAG TPA: hypothetical protein VLL54_01280 [Pyrinomonadaceae bacterium]|nr:hypothetical protein [Pyrinomonadaceae bacterium]